MGRPKKIKLAELAPEIGDAPIEMEVIPTFVEPVKKMYADKLIVSQKMVEINGKAYTELTLEDGSTVLL